VLDFDGEVKIEFGLKTGKSTKYFEVIIKNVDRNSYD